MDRITFQRIVHQRVKEARTLLRAGHSPGAYYLVGYAVECALKACVVKQFKKYDLPDRKFVDRVYTHDLGDLVRLAELAPAFAEARRLNGELAVNWGTVENWTESSRYALGITEAKAMFSACTSPSNGVLPWIKAKW